ncbi:unnamed protein product [Rangifer tarandus platyrhynchus]|uniref:Uncharacterized protein n=1 Tax=Rangifer tarandus platyrhynchus TaxID=3082113 RepID=A0ABN8Y797_RANTA|nr:unnamed protein product [Rangifer tarandus platyrhynchus]
MPNSVRSTSDQPPFVLLAALSPELLPFLETRPLLRASTSAALPPSPLPPGLLAVGGLPLCSMRRPLPSGVHTPASLRPSKSRLAGGPSRQDRLHRRVCAEPSGRRGLAHQQPCSSGPDSRSPEQGRAARPAYKRTPWPPASPHGGREPPETPRSALLP